MTRTSSYALRHDARKNLRLIVCISILLLVESYIGGHINAAYRYALDETASLIARIELSVGQECDQLLREIILAQDQALERRIAELQTSLRRQYADPNICIRLNYGNNQSIQSHCKNPNVLSPLNPISVHPGGSTLGTIQIWITPRSEIDEALQKSLSSLFAALVTAALATGFIFWRAEKNILAPFAETIRKKERDTAIAQTIQMMAHDVRRPFSIMQIVIRELKLASSFHEVQDIIARNGSVIEQSTQAITAHLNEILSFGSDSSLNMSAIDISDLLTESYRDILRLKVQKNIQIETNFSSQAWSMIDRQKIRRVFDNIIANAIEASKEGGLVNISTKIADNHIIISVQNAGRHIPDTLKTDIFSPFVTLGKEDGTGLGLAIAKKYVDEHKGAIWCENKPGPSVLFHIKLKRCSNVPYNKDVLTEANWRKPSAAPITQRDHIKVLVVDDELIFQESLHRDIQRLKLPNISIQVVFAETGEQALSEYMRCQPDLVICDHDLGSHSGISGTDLMVALRRLSPRLPIAIHTNRIKVPDIAELNRIPGVFQISKPATPDELRKFLTNSPLQDTEALSITAIQSHL